MSIDAGNREMAGGPGHNLKSFMDVRGLKANAWAKRADVTPATLYNFVNGKSHSLSSDTVVRLAKAAEVPPAILFDHIFGEGRLGAPEPVDAPAEPDDRGNGPSPTVEAEAAGTDEDLPLEDVSDTIRGMAERAAQRQGLTLGQFVASAIASQSLKTIGSMGAAERRPTAEAGDADDAPDRFGAVWSGVSPSLGKRHRRHRRYL